MEHERTMGTTGTWSPDYHAESTSDRTAAHLRAAAKSAREGVEHAGEYINETMARTQDAVNRYREGAQDAVNRYREGGVEQVKQDVVGYTREQPMTALVVASAVGVVLGMLIALGRSR
jgi:ElaB/YqjD/DUF883 family membrane-anchored ribosome-binding protein